MKETGSGDHGRIIGREPRRWGEDLDTASGESFPHGGDERRVARDPATEHDSAAPELANRASGFLDERIDQRVLERAGNCAALRVEIDGGFHGVECCGLETAE